MSRIRKISTGLEKVSTGWVTLVALVIMLLFMVFVLPGQSSKAVQNTGSSQSPDTSLWYSATTLYQMAESYGPQGRQAYIQARFTFDLVFPLVYTFFLVTAISWLFKHAFPADSLWRLSNLVPLLGMFFDFLENIATSLVMASYPAKLPLVAFLAPIFTLIKWIFVTGSFGLLLIGVVAYLINLVWRRRH
jgi:hypothetical protein